VTHVSVVCAELDILGGCGLISCGPRSNVEMHNGSDETVVSPTVRTVTVGIADAMFSNNTTPNRMSGADASVEITQNKGHFAVQGDSRSPILVPIESSYTTSY